jgi:putative ubiquitin-RnfH superfamily antitoxin RatB of RatAB toxin-antitoxin module
VKVEVACASADHQLVLELDVPAGSTVEGAIELALTNGEFRDLIHRQDLDVQTATVGVWGEPVERTRPLVNGDRVEIYRPLLIDPKEARRLRQQKRG